MELLRDSDCKVPGTMPSTRWELNKCSLQHLQVYFIVHSEPAPNYFHQLLLPSQNSLTERSDVHAIIPDSRFSPKKVCEVMAKLFPLSSRNNSYFSSVQLFSCVRLFASPWIAARQASLSITNSWNSLRLTSIESVMPSSHLILCCPLLLLPPVPPSIRVFSNESTLRMRWPKYWSFSFSIIPSKEHPGPISFRMDWWISLQSKGLSGVLSNTIVQKHQFFSAQLSSQSNSHIHTWPLEKP